MEFWNYGALVPAYFLGAIPFAYLAGRMKKVDVRTQGSGNIGTTNAFRLLGVKYGMLVFLGDVLKGVLATVICFIMLGPWGAVGGGLLAILGHMRNPFFAFKPTGKGVATGLGILIVLVPKIALCVLAAFALTVLFTRYVSLGSTAAALTAMAAAIYFAVPVPYELFIFTAAAFIIFRHRANYQRLRQGTEPKVKF